MEYDKAGAGAGAGGEGAWVQVHIVRTFFFGSPMVLFIVRTLLAPPASDQTRWMKLLQG